MIKSKFIFFVLLAMVFNTSVLSNTKIVYKINNEIITNVDVQNEIQYLIALNNQLNTLEKEQLINIAKESIIREQIKKNELLKYYLLDQTNPLLKEIVKNFYTELNIDSEKEFEQYLLPYNLTIKKLLEKFEIETTWNQLIYEKYNNQVKINEKNIRDTIKKNPINKNQTKYLLSEILFENKDKVTLDIQVQEINESINVIGFKNTANTFSISDTAKFGGSIGWVGEFNLSKLIVEKIKNLKIGEVTKPILLGTNYLIVKLEDKKIELVKVNAKQNLEKLIKAERERQLNQFSNIYYNKIKINTQINEL